MTTKIAARIAHAEVWHVFFGMVEQPILFIGDDESKQEFLTHDRSLLEGFVNGEDVLAELGLRIEQTPFVHKAAEPYFSPGSQLAEDPAAAPVRRSLGSKWELPNKESIDAFAATIGKSIRFYSLRSDLYDGIAVYECFRQKT